jgi:hypothetical protein
VPPLSDWPLGIGPAKPVRNSRGGWIHGAPVKRGKICCAAAIDEQDIPVCRADFHSRHVAVSCAPFRTRNLSWKTRS